MTRLVVVHDNGVTEDFTEQARGVLADLPHDWEDWVENSSVRTILRLRAAFGFEHAEKRLLEFNRREQDRAELRAQSARAAEARQRRQQQLSDSTMAELTKFADNWIASQRSGSVIA